MIINKTTLRKIKNYHIIFTQHYGLNIDTVLRLRQMICMLNHLNLKRWCRCIFWEDFLFIDQEMFNWIISDNYKMDYMSVADRECMEIMVKDTSWISLDVKTFSWREHIKKFIKHSDDFIYEEFYFYIQEQEQNYFFMSYIDNQYLIELRNRKIEIIYE